MHALICVIQGYSKESKRLAIATTPNQDPLLCKWKKHVIQKESKDTNWINVYDFHTIAHVPLLGVDVWEHVSY